MATQTETFDLIVVGGGPGGSTLASLVAAEGHNVLLLEKDKHPRYQIGESLLPNTLGVCKMLGVLPQVERAGFTPKTGGIWYWGRNQEGFGFDFGELPGARRFGKNWSYQVERRKFDKILIDHAKKTGVTVRERREVLGLLEEDGRIVGVRYRDPGGKKREARARYVADAGGNGAQLHKHVGERSYVEHFRNVALFCYYKGGRRMPAPRSGNILNVTFDKGWFWYIPLKPDLTSVGAVIPSRHAELLKGGHERAMKRFIDACPKIKEFLGDTPRVKTGVYGKFRVRKDWSYYTTKFWRPGLVLIGDAACFVDPLFSTGVHLATYSAALAARALDRCLRAQNEQDAATEAQHLDEFEKAYQKEYGRICAFLIEFYDQNKTKEQYFEEAQKILHTQETDRQAFIRLVSGFAQYGGTPSGDLGMGSWRAVTPLEVAPVDPA